MGFSRKDRENKKVFRNTHERSSSLRGESKRGSQRRESFDRDPPLLRFRRNPAFNYVALGIAGACVGLMSLLLGAAVLGLTMFWSYFSSPMVIILNLLPPILFIFLVYFISGRPWIAFTFPALITLFISVVHFFKIQIRGDPLIVSDILLVREVSKVIAPYTFVVNWKIYFVIAAFIAGVAFSIFFLKHKIKRTRFRIVSSAAVVAISAVLYLAVYMNAGLYDNTAGNYSVHEWSTTHNYIAKGFLYPFIHSIKGTLADLRGSNPDWYDAGEAKQLLESYGDAGIPDDKKVNIIALTLESYIDFSTFNVLDFKEDVYGPFHRVQAESYTGMLITNTFSGGTTDAERLFLTGNTRLTPYASATNSYVYYLKNQGYYTEGLHAGDMWFYDRRPINVNLGFDNYFFLEDFGDSNRYDWFFFPTVSALYNARDKGTPYFSYNLSYQNHGPYDSSSTRDTHFIERGGLSEESFNILNNYLIGISDTTRRIEGFLEMLRADPDPVVVVGFGDHMPWMGSQNSVYIELGINIDRGTEAGFYNFYSAPYFIWANDAAKATLGNDFSGSGGSFSPSFLMGEVFRLCSWQGEGYMQALRELKTSVDVINTPVGIYRENGVLTGTLSPESEAALQRLHMMEIYRRNNFRG